MPTPGIASKRLESFIGGNLGQDGGITRLDLSVEHSEQLPALTHAELVQIVLGPIGFGDAHLEKLKPPCGQFGQTRLGQSGRGRRRWGNGTAVVAQHESVDGIGLGALALSAREVAHASSFHHAHRHLGGMEGADHGLFVAAGGFANDLDGGMIAQEFQ
jgi:hypothetical protein